ncbi:MAG TPA: GNAT family N-acetyltransferase [Candidatus Pacearchaeota archaeon]|nr:GNAT family N-acetyltransferase [Candidatus Pacearchaeota archaeon]HPR80132.1 GNAT family N-acetyltransferase [Candidatus Pacearchaeota archaeon]
MDIRIKKVETNKEIIDAQEVRRKVFIEEQGIDSELDIDGKDESSEHIIIYLNNEPIATLRIRYLDEKIAKIERTSVLKKCRGIGFGKKIMDFTLSYLQEKKQKEIKLYSQENASGFYEKLGFKKRGEIFEEVGIPHIEMFLYIKDFDGWNAKKKELDKKNKSLYYYEREIWWCSLGINIGYETDGKNDEFERPVLILKTFGNGTFWMLPLTSKIKENPYYYKCTLEGKEETSCVVLSQVKLISEKRLIRKMTMLPKEDFQKIKEEIIRFL